MFLNNKEGVGNGKQNPTPSYLLKTTTILQ